MLEKYWIAICGGFILLVGVLEMKRRKKLLGLILPTDRVIE